MVCQLTTDITYTNGCAAVSVENACGAKLTQAPVPVSVFSGNNATVSQYTEVPVVNTPVQNSTSSSSEGGFWSSLCGGFKAFGRGIGNLLGGCFKAVGGILGFGGKMVGGLGAALSSSNLGFGVGVGLGAYEIYNYMDYGCCCGFGGFGFGGWPFMTTSGFYSPLCCGVGGMHHGGRSSTFVAGGFPTGKTQGSLGSSNLSGGAFGTRPIAGMHASQDPLSHYWGCGNGGRDVFGFR